MNIRNNSAAKNAKGAKKAKDAKKTKEYCPQMNANERKYKLLKLISRCEFVHKYDFN